MGVLPLKLYFSLKTTLIFVIYIVKKKIKQKIVLSPSPVLSFL